MASLQKYDWILAITSIAFCGSAFGNGANDVANSYATSVAARTLTMPQAGVLAMITEFVGAVALGSRVTDTIKNGIIDIDRFSGNPGTLMLAMGAAEIGSAFWLLTATGLGYPVSTTQTIVGALIGVGIAAQAAVTWAWTDGSVSQVAASWGIAPLIAAAFSAIIFGSIKYAVLERRDPLKWGLRLIPFYLALTAAILALFIVIEVGDTGGLDGLGAGRSVGIILGVFAGCLAVAYGFFLPYFHRRLIKCDARLRARHIPLGPLLWKEDPPLYWPAPVDGDVVINYYQSFHDTHDPAQPQHDHHSTGGDSSDNNKNEDENDNGNGNGNGNGTKKETSTDPSVLEKGPAPTPAAASNSLARKQHLEPEERFLAPTEHLPLYHPSRLWSYVKYILLQGVTRDCVTFSSERLADTHSRAKRYDNRVEHLWTYAQVASAMVMSISHGSNDVANSVGPWVASYETFRAGTVQTETPTPVWILVIAGFLLGAGFWFYGYHIIRALGNRITQMSPTRGFSMELGAAITVLLASRLGLPVSTTQCLTGATVGAALMNYDVAAVNWRHMLKIFSGWVMTLPSAGLIGGLLCVMALNTPHF